MVHSMPYDRGGVPRVAWFPMIVGFGAALSACVPANIPKGPGDGTNEGVGVVNHGPRPKPVANGRQVVIGEMCPLGAAGRPGLAPIAMRGVQWSDTAAEIAAVVERGGTPSYEVFGNDGKVAGQFDTLGMAEVGVNQPVVSGGYTGAPPCTYNVTPTIPDAPNVRPGATPPSGKGSGVATAAPLGPPISTRAEDPRCVPATTGCGLAVGEIVHPDDPPSRPVYAVGGACITGDELAVDIDGDGTAEAFPLAGLLDGSHAPAAEWTAAPKLGAPCTPTFQVFDIHLGQEEGGKVDPRGAVTMDVLGVVDVDGDGRRELVLALRFPTVRTIVIYTPTSAAQRLELAGEATSFPR